MAETLRESFFTHQEYRNFFLEGGEGEPVVFLHPLGGSVDLWEKNLSFFAGRFRVFALDFLGCGRSDKPDITYDLPSFVERLVAFLDARGVEKATLVGNSLGGHVAMLTAVYHPTRVAKLVLANPSGLHAFPRPVLSSGILLAAQMLWRTSLRPSKRILRTVLRRLYGAPGDKARKLSEFYVAQMEGKDGEQWSRAFTRTLQGIFSTPIDEQIKETHQPTLILWGRRDHLLGRNGGDTLHHLIPGSRLEILKGVGHFPPFEAPDLFNGAVKEFLRSE